MGSLLFYSPDLNSEQFRTFSCTLPFHPFVKELHLDLDNTQYAFCFKLLFWSVVFTVVNQPRTQTH